MTHENLTKLGLAASYDFTRPTPLHPVKTLNTFTGIKHVFNDPAKYKVIYGPDMNLCTQGHGFLLSYDDPARHDSDKAMVVHALWPDMETMNDYIEFYKTTTHDLIKAKSFTYDGLQGNFVDIVGEVINIAGVHWVAERMVMWFVIGKQLSV